MQEESKLETAKILLERIDKEIQLKNENQKIFIALTLAIFTASGFLLKEFGSQKTQDIIFFALTILCVFGLAISYTWGSLLHRHYQTISTIQDKIEPKVKSILGDIDYTCCKIDELLLPKISQFIFIAGIFMLGFLPPYIKQYIPNILSFNIHPILKLYLSSLPLLIVLGITPCVITKSTGIKCLSWWTFGTLLFPIAIASALTYNIFKNPQSIHKNKDTSTCTTTQ